jgi:cytochrome c peroxidase
MKPRRLIAVAVVAWVAGVAGAGEGDPQIAIYPNQFGLMGTFSAAGPIDLTNPFFEDLGSNGRTCVSCHQPDSAWSITPANVQLRFLQSRGQEAIFRNNDGSNCEGIVPTDVEAKRDAYSLLLTRGVIRVGLDVPSNAEFVVEDVRDPYNCLAPSTDVSVYRRPLPSTNLTFLSAVMWDGRESSQSTTIRQDLLHQANGATRGHAAGFRDLTEEEATKIVDFETGLFAAQLRDLRAGDLRAMGATGGPQAIAAQPFYLGINDPVGLNPTGAAFDRRAFTLFDAWMTLALPASNQVSETRRAIARGQEIFNSKPIILSGVGGLNGQTFANGVTPPASFVGTCTVCHDSPNAGNHSVKAPLDIGLTDPDVAPYLPVYTLRNIQTGERLWTTDPGRALISGKWADVNRFKGPVLRALAARPPYFHNGSAQTLDDVIDFYEKRFRMGLTVQERSDLLAFLRTL